MSLIIDASLTVSWYFDDEATPATEAVLDTVSETGAVVPTLWQLGDLPTRFSLPSGASGLPQAIAIDRSNDVDAPTHRRRSRDRHVCLDNDSSPRGALLAYDL